VAVRNDAPARNPNWQALALNALSFNEADHQPPDDPYEQEADHIADQMMRIAAPQSINSTLSFSSSGSLKAQRKCAPFEEKDKRLHAKTRTQAPTLLRLLRR